MTGKRRPLHEIVRDLKSLFWMIADSDAGDPNEGDGLQAELEACQAEMQDKVQACLALACSYHAQSGAVRDRARVMMDRAARLNKRALSLEQYVKAMLDSMGLDRYGTTDYPAIRVKRNPPRLEIDDDATIPDGYIETVQSVRVRKAEIKSALREGEEVPGCRLVQGTRLDY